MACIDQQMGNYRLVRLVGQGHFADVYLGEHLYLKTFAAIKILHAAVNRDVLRQFLQEAQAVAHLGHPHIIRVLDFGVDAASHTPFLVMEYARHGSLRQRYPEGQRLQPALLLRYVLQIAAALQYAHDHRLIHRDVKPENILLGVHDEILLSDFSLVTVAHSTASLETLDNAGTVHYMAPEQLHGKPRPASDQYSLAVMVYEWLCGERPFYGSTPIEIAVQHMTSSPPSLLERMPALNPAIASVVQRALAKDPERRFPTVMAFAQALATAIEQPARSAMAPSVNPVVTTGPVTDDGDHEEVPAFGALAPIPSATSTAHAVSTPLLDPPSVRHWREVRSSFRLPSPAKDVQTLPPAFLLQSPSSVFPSSSYYTVLDIGSTYARAAIIRTNAAEQVEILGVGRFSQAEGSLSAGMVDDVKGTVTACNEALLKAERMAGKLVAPDALVGIGGELMRGSSLTVSVERATPTVPIAMPEFKALIEQAAQELCARLRGSLLSESGESDLALDIIDMQVSAIFVDGQPAATPFGMSGRELSFRLFVNCIPHSQYRAILEVIEKLDLNLAGLTTTPVALAHYMQGSDEFMSDAILLDVGGQATRIAVIFDGRPVYVSAFAFGGDDFTQCLATNLHLSRDAAEPLKLSYGRGVLKGARRGDVQSLLVPEYQRWLVWLCRQLAEFADVDVLPSTFYLAGGGLALPDFRSYFCNSAWWNSLPLVRAPRLYPMRVERHPWVKDARSLLRDAGEIALVAISTTALLASPSPMQMLLSQLRYHYSMPSS